MSIIVGVDAGGTRTTAVVADDERELARAEGPAGAVRPGRAMAAAGTIATVVRAALVRTGRVRAEALVVGASGVGRDEERQALRDALRMEALADRLLVTTDIEIALVAAFGKGPGVVLLSGTGSFAVARAADGSQRRQGGYGWRMGDEGSAYALGEAALRAAGRAQDGRGETTTLTEALCRQTRSATFNDLVRWSVAATPTEVAALATTALAAAEAGDAVASRLVTDAANSLAGLVAGLSRDLSDGETLPVAMAGGLLGHPRWRAEVRRALERFPGIALVDDPVDPVLGALRLGKGLSGR